MLRIAICLLYINGDKRRKTIVLCSLLMEYLTTFRGKISMSSDCIVPGVMSGWRWGGAGSGEGEGEGRQHYLL